LGIKGRPNIVLAGSAISGQPNFNGNDGTAARFGWKAQNKSLLLFSGEAYNVEMGITNELFQTERDEYGRCQFAATPNATTNADAPSPVDAVVAIEKFAFFMRFLAPPAPHIHARRYSVDRGRPQAVHQDRLQPMSYPDTHPGNSTVAALSYQPVICTRSDYIDFRTTTAASQVNAVRSPCTTHWGAAKAEPAEFPALALIHRPSSRRRPATTPFSANGVNPQPVSSPRLASPAARPWAQHERAQRKHARRY
jgi:hypothetical protein